MHLLTEAQLQTIIKADPLNSQSIIAFANKFNTSAGVIIGRLQHLEFIGWSMDNELQKKIKENFKLI